MQIKSLTVGALAGAAFAIVALGSSGGLGGRAAAEPQPPYTQHIIDVVRALERGNQVSAEQVDATRDLARAVERAGEKCGR